MNNEEIIFDAFNESRYAPSLKEFSNTLFDAELNKEIKNIPEKLAFKIGEVADIANVKTYVLRYWETEFDQLRPQKSTKNQRVYLKRDVEMVLMIKKLLYRDRFSIEGARVALKQLKRDSKQVKAVGGTLDR
jgi:MerR HTH family regulatory protein